MFRNDISRHWNCGSTLAPEEDRSRGPLINLNRRQVLALPAWLGATSVAWTAAFAQSPPAIVLSDIGAEIRFGSRLWILRNEAFGKGARIELLPAGTSGVRVTGANWTGTGIGYALRLAFVDQGGWMLEIDAPELGFRAARYPFEDFLDGRARATVQPGGNVVACLARALGWTVSGTATRPATLTFLPDLDWELGLSARASLLNGLFFPDRLVVAVHGPGNSPLAGFAASPAGWSTSATARDLRLRRRPRLRCGTATEGRSVELEPRNIAAALVVRWEDGGFAIGLQGVWRMKTYSGSRRTSSFESANGLVLLGGDRQQFISAVLPVGEEEQLVELPSGSACIRGSDPQHQAVVEAVRGRIRRCDLRAALAYVPIPLEGADFSQLEFEGEEIYAALSGASPSDMVSVIFSTGLWGRWRIPLGNARLRVARARDLLSLGFRFENAVLVRRLLGWRLEIDRRGAPIRMAAEFPPQHVLEQAYFQQVNSDPSNRNAIPPRVPLDEEATRDRATGDFLEGQALENEKKKRDADNLAAPSPYDHAKLVPPAEARLSGESRLAFAIQPHRWRRRLPIAFTLDGLTDWERLALNVVPVAETLLDADGRPEANPVRILDKMHIRPIGAQPNPAALRARLAQVLALVPRDGQVGRFQTSIELPARLTLSPDQNAVFTTRSPNFRRSPLKSRERSIVPIWSARLTADRNIEVGGEGYNKRFARNEVRAVASPDFAPNAFDPGDYVPQTRNAPWDPSPNPRELRLPLSSKDRHELVALSALYGLPVLPRLKRRPATAGANATDHDPLPDSMLPREGLGLPGFDEQALYLPPAMSVHELRLTSLGGSLGINARFEPPAAPYWADQQGPPGGPASPFPALTIEAWNQRTTLGRDQFVEVIYKGFLFPIGHRASLLKRTERMFIGHPTRDDPPVAFLIQRYFIRINKRDKHFPALGQAYEGRDFPVSKLRFRRAETPDILDPTDRTGPVSEQSAASGKLLIPGIKGDVFWPRTRAGVGGEVQFELFLEDREAGMTLPLLFLDNTAAHDPCSVNAVNDYYMSLRPQTRLTTAIIGGGAHRYAPENKPGSTSFDTARWVLGSRGRGDRLGAPFQMDAAMEGEDQPPFYPFKREAHVILRSLQQFSGRTKDHAVVSFDDLYVRNGFAPGANPSELFLAVHGYLPAAPGQWFDPPGGRLEPVRLDLNGTGDRSGGIAQPNVVTVAMSRIGGPVGGQAAPGRRPYAVQSTSCPPIGGPVALISSRAVQRAGSDSSAGGARGGMFSGADFFPADAKLLGILPLRDLVKTALYAGAPKLLEQAEAAADRIEEQVANIRRELEPLVRAATTTLAEASRLLDTETPLTHGSPPTPYSVRDLYPRLGTALDSTGRALEMLRAETAAATGGELARLRRMVDAVKAFNGGLTDTLSELDRIGRDPIPPELGEIISGLVGGAKAFMARMIADPLPNELEDRLFRLVEQRALEAANVLFAQSPERWIAAVLGPDAYPLVRRFVDESERRNLRELIAALASTAAEALCYEWVGRPVLDAIASAEKLVSEAAEVAVDDFRAFLLRSLETVERIADAAIAAVQAPLTLQAGCEAAAGKVKTVFDTIRALCTAGANGLIRDLGEVDAGLREAEEVLARIATIEAELEACVRQSSGARQRARMAGVNASAADVAHSKVVAAKETVTRLRTGLASAVQRMRDTLASLKIYQADIAAIIDRPCEAVARVNAFLGAANRWMTHRLRLVADVEVLFRAVAEAAGAQIPGGGQRSSMRPTGSACADQAERLLNIACGEAAGLVSKGCAILQELTSLRQGAETAVAAAINQAVTAIGGIAASEIGKAVTEFEAVQKRVQPQIAALETKLAGVVNEAEGLRAAALRTVLNESASLILEATSFAREQERRILGAITAPLAAAEAATIGALIDAGATVAKALLPPLIRIHVLIDALWQPLRDAAGDNRLLLEFILRPEIFETLLGTQLKTELDADKADLESILADLDNGNSAAAFPRLLIWRDRIRAARGVAWTGPAPAPVAPAAQRLAQDLGETLSSLLHGRIQDLVDVKAIRRNIERALIDIALPRINVSYGLATDINDLPPFFRMSEDRTQYGGEEGASDLKLDFEMNLDLQNPGVPAMTAKGVLQPFEVNIFQVVTLYFRKAEFSIVNGGKPKLDIKVGNVELGAAVAFIQKLQETLGIGAGSGFFLNINVAPPGVEAGFMIDLGTVSIGTVSFINVSLGASVELPFTNDPARFRFNLARRAAPFLISAAPFGGGGFLSVITSAKGLEGFEASFEYGGVIGFGFGPLRGNGRVTTGIYVAQSRTSTRLAGFFVAAGSAHIACFSLSASLVVSIEQQNGGNVIGSATYSFSFSIGIKDFKYSVRVTRTIAKGWSGGAGRGFTLLRSDHVLGLRSEARFLAAPARDYCTPTRAPVSNAVAMNHGWRTYRDYFEEAL